jgi:hypothetical protein
MRTACAFVAAFLLASRVLALDLQVKEVRAASRKLRRSLSAMSGRPGATL